MLNGVQPIIIFEFKKTVTLTNEEFQNLPIAQLDSFVANGQISLPPIPIYLDERITGLAIDSETKSIDIETETQTLKDGNEAQVKQKGINSVVTINLIGTKDSLGLTLLVALMDLVFQKVTAQEYTITYLNGATTVFRGLLHSFSFDSDSDTTKLPIQIQLSRSNLKAVTPPSNIPVVSASQGTVPL